MTNLSPRLELLFARSKTVCFGRFVLEVPASASIVFGPAEAEIPIVYLPDEGANFQSHVDEQVVEVENERSSLSTKALLSLPMYGKVIEGDRPKHKIVIGSKNQVGYSMYSFVAVENGLFVQEVHNALAEPDRFQSVIGLFNKVATRLRLRSNDEVPRESGTCIDGGFVPGELAYEKVSLGIRLAEFPDVHFSVEAHKKQNKLAESTNLERLLNQAKARAGKDGLGAIYARVKTLRRGSRTLGDWEGFEILARKPVYQDETDAHEFRFRSLGSENDPLRPQLDIQLDTGLEENRKAGTTPSITDEEAVALWDKLIGSIRVRTAFVEELKVNEMPTVALGQPTGSVCIQTGSWQCTQSGCVEESKLHYFKAGDILPAATFYTLTSFWQSLMRDRPTHSMATSWRLVSYNRTP